MKVAEMQRANRRRATNKVPSRLESYTMSQYRKIARNLYKSVPHFGKWYYTKLYIWGNDEKTYVIQKLFEGRSQNEADTNAFVFMAEASKRNPSWKYMHKTKMVQNDGEEFTRRKVGVRHFLNRYYARDNSHDET